jgi:hypothetical protein
MGSLDAVISLPSGLLVLINKVRGAVISHSPFYNGWDAIHSDWTVKTSEFYDIKDGGFWTLLGAFFPPWGSILLGFILFALFGLQNEVLSAYSNSYAKLLDFVRRMLNSKSLSKPEMSVIGFSSGKQDDSTDLESGCVNVT